MRKVVTAAIVLLLLAGSGTIWLRRVKPWRSAQEVMDEFYNPGMWTAEDMLMDPLILNTGKVAPLVIKEIQNREMAKRRYAICFLGNEGIEDAVPVLKTI